MTIILGAGSWGTALAIVLAREGQAVTLCAHSPELADQISRGRENQKYLPGYPLPETVEVLAGYPSLQSATALLLAVPSSAIREVAGEIGTPREDLLVINAAKGLESATGKLLSAVLREAWGPVAENCVALSGPNLAVELAQAQPGATVVASRNAARAEAAQKLLSGRCLRVYTSTDLTGVQLGGALKNILAVAAGISDGLGFGDNSKAALLTRGLAEITRLGTALGGEPGTFMGLSGLGDMLATCASPLSRNLRVGRLLGQGIAVEAALQEVKHVAEGIPTTEAALHLIAQTGVECPIISATAQILFQHASPAQVVQQLMARSYKAE